ncbi:pectate lyase [Candidatus Sumerlaeota bacterium]|nr:pectate lyase [Candidatus Sumerlaeota bacterium]
MRRWCAVVCGMVLLGSVGASVAGAAGFPWNSYARRAEDWYRSDEAKRVAGNVLSQQSKLGDWPSNMDTGAQPFEGKTPRARGTFDNGATRGEVRFLARAHKATGNEEYRAAALRGLDHILKAQYSNGGWPQSYPPGTKYPRHITFNDWMTVGLMELMREVGQSADFSFVDAERRARARDAFDRGVQCILKCQIVVNGELTAWCQQHDEVTFEPRPARTFEPVAICAGESVGMVELLMSLDKPSAEVIRAVDAACRWFERVKITGIRQETRDGDKVVVKDPNASPLWARMYEIGTNRPIFCGRDGVVKYSLAEIELERRIHYAWYGEWPRSALAKWPQWREKHTR